MQAAVVSMGYITWHYSRAFRDMLTVWMNVFWFIFHFFSVGTLLRTFFSPFKRIREEHRQRGLEDLAATILVNTMTRIVGAFARLVILIVAFVTLAVCIALFFVWLFFWVLAPVALVYALLFGISLLV